jgi:hypothetical protein
MRPRIRTLKPEIWEDEAVGRLGPWERLLFIGLITMADDEGRLRALPNAIAGHVFPYDNVPAAKLKSWLKHVADAGLVVVYDHAGTPYAQICGWARHQKINRATGSEIPAPSLNGHGRRTTAAGVTA